MIRKYNQSNLRKARIYDSKNPYFVTICTSDKIEILTKNKIPEILINNIKWFIGNSVIINLGFVIMPDHLHWAFASMGESTLNNILRRYKSFAAKKIKEELCWNIKIWQDCYYDHLLRDIRDFRIKLDYMHNNPVRKGIVKRPAEYLHSTANEKYVNMINWDYVGF
jgi:REP element-mobilizing transposase RayT